MEFLIFLLNLICISFVTCNNSPTEGPVVSSAEGPLSDSDYEELHLDRRDVTTQGICADKSDNCRYYPPTICDPSDHFRQFAEEVCPVYCKFCTPFQLTGCTDKRMDCSAYPAEICTDLRYRIWVEDNCAKFCNVCPPTAITTTATTITTTTDCRDKIDNCRVYEDTLCGRTGPFVDFAKANCAAYCKFCVAPTTYHECKDTIPDCDTYPADLCYNRQYKLFVEDNCPKFCAKCGTGSPPPSPTGLITTPTPVNLTGDDCRNLLHNCDYYEDDACVGKYEPWGKLYCPLRCGYCVGMTETCEDLVNYCNVFTAGFCEKYPGWSRTNCKKFCDMCHLPAASNETTGQTGSPGGNPEPGHHGQPSAPDHVLEHYVIVAESHKPSVTIQGGISDAPAGYCQYLETNIAENSTHEFDCLRTCRCQSASTNTVICRNDCPIWDNYPKNCQLKVPPGDCCKRLICQIS